jgi:invasion protein IalB
MKKFSYRTAVLAFSLLAATSSFELFAQTKVEKTDPKADPPSTKRWNHTVGDWVVACALDAAGKKGCAMSQTLSDNKTKQVVAALTIAKGEAEKPTATVRAPLGLLVSSAVQVTIEGQNAFGMPLRTCLNTGCFGSFEITPAILANMKKANKVSLAMQSAQNRPVNVEFSMRGFPKAYDTYAQEAAAK